MKKAIILMLALILLASNVLAIGVSPARTAVDFKPGLEQDISITILNSEHRDVKIEVYTEDKTNLVSIHDKKFEMKSNEASREIKIKLKLPKEMATPGIYDIDIVAKQLPDEEFPSPLFITTELAVISQIRIKTPYPAKYADVSGMEITNAIANSTANFKIPIVNFGSENITELKAKISIMGPDNKKVAEIETQTESLQIKRRVLLEANWDTKSTQTGKYYAIAEVTYDGLKGKTEKTFNLGKLIIKLLRVETNNYQLGGIGKFDIWVESEWNEKIEGLFGELTIRNSDNATVSHIKTPTLDLEPYTPTPMSAFWDTAGLSIGEYFINLRLMYKGVEQEANLISDLTYNAINTRVITGEVTKNGKLSWNSIIPIAIIILLIVNIIIFARKRKPPVNEPKKLSMGNA